VTANNNKKEEN